MANIETFTAPCRAYGSTTLNIECCRLGSTCLGYHTATEATTRGSDEEKDQSQGRRKPGATRLLHSTPSSNMNMASTPPLLLSPDQATVPQPFPHKVSGYHGTNLASLGLVLPSLCVLHTSSTKNLAEPPQITSMDSDNLGREYRAECSLTEDLNGCWVRQDNIQSRLAPPIWRLNRLIQRLY